MSSYVSEIVKILRIVDSVPASKEETYKIAKNIFEEPTDGYLNISEEIYVDEFCSMIQQFCGKTVKACDASECANCHINKWCGHYRNQAKVTEKNRNGFTYADFFCGAGGLSLGFRHEGFRVGLANDIQNCCIETYTFNHPEVPKKHVIAGDINDVISQIDELKRYEKIDVVVGGPPCQGFSMANRQRLIDDPRNRLYKSYIAAVGKLKPKFVIMENVRGILKVEEQIKEDFGKIGYSISARLLNAKDFGVPQNRERVIFIGNSIGIDNDAVFDALFESVLQQKRHNLSDAIYNMRPLSAKRESNHTEDEDDLSGYTIAKPHSEDQNNYLKLINDQSQRGIIFNHKARYNNARDIEIFGRLLPGDDSTDIKIQDIMPYKRREKIFKDKYYKLEMDRPCKTITAHMKYDCNMYIHPEQARGLTPREAARVQSYPDDYFFRGAYTTTYMQVGNSVPPLLSRAIAKILKRYLEDYDNGSI